MMRSVLMAIVTLAVGQSARAQHEHAEPFTKCAKVCADCQLACETCSKHCLALVAEGKKAHAETAQLCADCAECCKTCSTICAREGPLARLVLDCCAKCCDECAAACEKTTGDSRMAACAKTCSDCAKECRAMHKKLGTR